MDENKHIINCKLIDGKKEGPGSIIFNENDNLQQTIRQAYTNLKKISNNFDIWVFDNNSNDASSTTIENLSAEIKELRLYKQKPCIGAEKIYCSKKYLIRHTTINTM